jgi:cytochrome P450
LTDFIPFADASADGVVDDDIDYNEDDIPRFHERLAELRAEKGAARLRFGPTTGWVLLRYADVASAVKDGARFSKSEAFRPVTFPFMGPNIQGYDGQEHTVKRALVAPAFRRTIIPQYVEPIFRPIAEEFVDEFATLGSTDLMEVFAKKYPMRITNRLLGIPAEDEEQMAAWAIAMLNILADPDGSIRANAEFSDYVRPLLDERRAYPKDDVLSALVTEEVEGQQLSEEEVLGFLRLLFPAGVDTTWLTLGSMMYAVMLHPEVGDRLLTDENERSWAVEETLRWESAVATEPRVTLEDVVVAGNTIPAGQMVRLILPSANRDPDVFAEPTRWDLDRRPSNHIAFGLGRHLCLGANLARGELTTALEVLLRRLPNLRLADEPVITGAVLRGPRRLLVEWDT